MVQVSMKPRRLIFIAALFAAVWGCVMAVQADPLVTLQSSTLSVPAASIALSGLPGSTNLTGTNFMISAVTASTLHGGRAALVNSQQWVRRYDGGANSDVFARGLR